MVAGAASPRTALVRRARRINRELARLYPDARIELNFTSPLELLVATILSARTTDRRVNEVTPVLFARYRTGGDYAAADEAELEKVIEPTGYYHAKAKALTSLGQALCDRFGGKVPDTLDELVTLPGVGRKTANVVLGEAFAKPGVVVDTHVARLARRFGWTAQNDPEKIERDIAALLPRQEWTAASRWLIWHGRRVCHARRPACGACGVARSCPSFWAPGYSVGFYGTRPRLGWTSRAGGLCPRPVRARDSAGPRGRSWSDDVRPTAPGEHGDMPSRRMRA